MEMVNFKLISKYIPKGDQPQAIDELVRSIEHGTRHQVLLGVTGSGKTFTMANVIARVKKPALIISHNKTLAAQLYAEFRQFFPHNAVEYFVSYYDYYQPEAYIPQTDTYIEKDSAINDQIDRLRLRAASSLLCRRDVIIVSSVSCIYGIGSPEEWKESLIWIGKGDTCPRQDFLKHLVHLQYERNDVDFSRGTFRVKGESVDLFPAYLETAYRIEFFGDEIERILEFRPLTGEIQKEHERVCIYPAKHFIISRPKLEEAIKTIRKELAERLSFFRSRGKLLEAQRLETRTNYDIEMLEETGYCHGIENYSRHLSGRRPGEPPSCLIHYFPEDYLLIIDESHATLPQINGMYNGDRSRKETLVEYGFRLPSALDNRPLKFSEFERLVNQAIYVSATPAPYEIKKSRGVIVEQVIRPTGLVDPEIIIKPVKNQVEDLIREIEKRAKKEERVLVTTLTKRMAEDLSDYLMGKGLKVRYLHSEIDTLKRVDILKSLRKGEFDCLIGINLLREGLDLPEVSLVAVLDADKEGFLRSETTLIQVCGRAARNVGGQIIMYADRCTTAMKKAIREMNRRRTKQMQYNRRHRITPRTIIKAIEDIEELRTQERARGYELIREKGYRYPAVKPTPQLIRDIESQMQEAADNLEFELAAILRDKIFELKGRKKTKTGTGP